MGDSPVWAATPKNGIALINTANANRDGSGTLGTVYTAGSNGGVIDAIFLQSAGAVGVAITAGMLRLFIETGGVARLCKEVPVTAGTPSASVAGWSALLTPGNGLPPEGLRLAAGNILKASTQIAENFNVVAQAGDF